MILRRLGNKKKIAKEIQKYFPEHKIYIEPFFGAGGMFFNKPKAKYNIVNDLDSDVFNLFQVVMNQREELEKAFYMMPIHSDLLDYWKENQEVDSIQKALRLLLISNFTYMGTGNVLRFGTDNTKHSFEKNIDKTFEIIKDVKFINKDFKSFFKTIMFSDSDVNPKDTLIYCDPPYINSAEDLYKCFTETDSNDLFDSLEETKCKFAMSEFDHPFILDQAEKRCLNIIYIGERQNLKNRRIEVLITNYKNNQQSLF